MKSQSRMLTLILAMQALILAGQWFGASTPTPAMAQIPDSGAQRSQMIESLKSIDGKLDRLVTLLDGGKLQVRVTASDEKNTGR